MTGEQGGKLLACYLYSLTDGPTWGTMLGPAFLERGAIPFLEKQLVKLQLFPSAKSLIEHSISFYPKLVQGLVLARAARETAAELDFGDDDDDSAGAGTAGAASMDFGEDEEVRPPPPPRMAHPIGPRRPSTAALTAAHRAHLDAALPVRNGDIAQSSFSRDATHYSATSDTTSTYQLLQPSCSPFGH